MKKKSPAKKKAATINVALDQPIHARLQAIALERRQPIGYLATKAVTHWLGSVTESA